MPNKLVMNLKSTRVKKPTSYPDYNVRHPLPFPSLMCSGTKQNCQPKNYQSEIVSDLFHHKSYAIPHPFDVLN